MSKTGTGSSTKRGIVIRMELRWWIWKRKLEDLFRFKILPIWYHYPKCQTCGHRYYDHVSYFEAPTREGVCVSHDTPNWDMCECEKWS